MTQFPSDYTIQEIIQSFENQGNPLPSLIVKELEECQVLREQLKDYSDWYALKDYYNCEKPDDLRDYITSLEDDQGALEELISSLESQVGDLEEELASLNG